MLRVHDDLYNPAAGTNFPVLDRTSLKRSSPDFARLAQGTNSAFALRAQASLIRLWPAVIPPLILQAYR